MACSLRERNVGVRWAPLHGKPSDSFVPHCGQLPAPAPQQVAKKCLQFHKARPLEQLVPVAHTGLFNLVRLANKRKAVLLFSFVRGYGSGIVRNAHTVVPYLGNFTFGINPTWRMYSANYKLTEYTLLKSLFP